MEGAGSGAFVKPRRRVSGGSANQKWLGEFMSCQATIVARWRQVGVGWGAD